LASDAHSHCSDCLATAASNAFSTFGAVMTALPSILKPLVVICR
jgi:hypothetical protein